MLNKLIMAALLAVLCLSGWARGDEPVSEPWTANAAAPVMVASVVVPRSDEGEAPSLASTVCFGWLRFYQRYLSVVTVSHCPLDPSCSNYSIKAIRAHGAFRGVVMTADRLIHEWDEQYYAPLIEVKGRLLYSDPVEANNLWSRTR